MRSLYSYPQEEPSSACSTDYFVSYLSVLKNKCYPISITIVHTRWAYPCKGSALYWASSIIYSIDFASYPTIGVPSRVQIFQRVLHELQITSRVLNSSTNKNSQSPHLQFLGIRLIHVVTNRTSVVSYGSIKNNNNNNIFAIKKYVKNTYVVCC